MIIPSFFIITTTLLWGHCCASIGPYRKCLFIRKAQVGEHMAESREDFQFKIELRFLVIPIPPDSSSTHTGGNVVEEVSGVDVLWVRRASPVVARQEGLVVWWVQSCEGSRLHP